MSEISVSKIDAAWEQLVTAIILFFNNESLVPIHTLAAASVQVFDDMAEGTSYEGASLTKRIFSLAPPEYQREVVNEFRKPQNFMKHADKDKDEVLVLKREHTELLLLCGTFLAMPMGFNLDRIQRAKKGYAVLAFQIWAHVEMGKDEDADDAKVFLNGLGQLPSMLFPDVPNLSETCSGSEFYEWFETVWLMCADEVMAFVSGDPDSHIRKKLEGNPLILALFEIVRLFFVQDGDSSDSSSDSAEDLKGEASE